MLRLYCDAMPHASLISLCFDNCMSATLQHLSAAELHHANTYAWHGLKAKLPLSLEDDESLYELALVLHPHDVVAAA